jgi:sarcosine oxidase
VKIAIVGAGVMGLNAALAAQSRGHQVTLYDQFDPLHTQGSSHGKSRIIRLDYPDHFYLDIMVDGYSLWKKVDKQLGGQIFRESGIFTFGDPTHPDLISLEQGLINHQLPYSKLAHTQSIFPALHLHKNEIAIHNARAGWASPDNFRQKSTDFLIAQGAQRIQEKVEDPVALKASYDAVIITAGAWAKQLFNLPVTVNCQTFAYLEVPNPQDHTKVWIEADEHGIYGFPPESPITNKIKFGVHSPGPEIDPANPDRPVTQAKLDLLTEFAQRRFGIKNPSLLKPESCLYTNTANTDFLWGEIQSGVYWASPCSGHGFKFGPWIGARLADFAEQKLHPSAYPRFNHII